MRLSLDHAVPRVCDALHAAKLDPETRALALAILAPEHDLWLSDEPWLELDREPPGRWHVHLSRLVARAEECFERLPGINLEQLAAMLDVLAPELMRGPEPEPTPAVPGSPDKVARMAHRRRQHQALFAEGDAKLPDWLGFKPRLAGNHYVRDGVVDTTSRPTPAEEPSAIPVPPAAWPVGRRGQLLLWVPPTPPKRPKRGKRPPRPAPEAKGSAWRQATLWEDAAALTAA